VAHLLVCFISCEYWHTVVGSISMYCFFAVEFKMICILVVVYTVDTVVHLGSLAIGLH